MSALGNNPSPLNSASLHTRASTPKEHPVYRGYLLPIKESAFATLVTQYLHRKPSLIMSSQEPVHFLDLYSDLPGASIPYPGTNVLTHQTKLINCLQEHQNHGRITL